MRIKVQAFASFHDVMDRELIVEMNDGSELTALLDELTGRYKGLGKALFRVSGELRDNVSIFRNGVNTESIGGVKTCLEDGNIIVLFPPASGG